MSDDIAELFDGAANAAVPQDTRDEATRLVETLAREEYAIAQLEVKLAERKKHFEELRSRIVPDAMLKANQSAFKVALGDFADVMVEIKDFVSGSLPKIDDDDPNGSARGRAIDWLEQHDGGELIKDEIVISFEKKEHNMALDLLHRLKAEGFNCQYTNNVHPMTLQAYARERLRNGETLDPDVLGLFVGRIAKLTWPKDTLPKVPKKGKKQ